MTETEYYKSKGEKDRSSVEEETVELALGHNRISFSGTEEVVGEGRASMLEGELMV